VISFLAPALVMLPLLGGVSTEAATSATNDPLGVLENHASLIRQAEDHAIAGGGREPQHAEGNGGREPQYAEGNGGREPQHAEGNGGREPSIA
jgi:hypothetical protein